MPKLYNKSTAINNIYVKSQREQIKFRFLVKTKALELTLPKSYIFNFFWLANYTPTANDVCEERSKLWSEGLFSHRASHYIFCK